MKKLFLIGSDIARSLSPKMHLAAIKYLNLESEFSYELMQITPENFARKIKNILSQPDVLGFNITTPFKSEINKYLDYFDPFANKCGACNYAKNENGRWIGKNTDGYGFIMPLIKRGVSIIGKKILILGSGGAARAVALQLINNGASEIRVINRDRVRGERFKQDICKLNKKIADFFFINSFYDLQIDKLSSIILKSDIVVNATSAFGSNPAMPVKFFPEMFNKNQIIYDLSYIDKVNNDFTLSAKSSNAFFLDGREMLVYQGLMSFVQWTSKKPPFGILKKAVDEGL